MAGLKRMLRRFGSVKVSDKSGRTVEYRWDYANDCPVTAEEMPDGSPRHAASERARFQSAVDAPEVGPFNIYDPGSGSKG